MYRSSRVSRENAARRASEAAETATLDAWANSQGPFNPPEPGPVRTLSLTCSLCGAHRFREIPEGERCESCGAVMGGPFPRTPLRSFDLDAHLRELDQLRREDEAHLRDLGADMGYGLHRSDGSL